MMLGHDFTNSEECKRCGVSKMVADMGGASKCVETQPNFRARHGLSAPTKIEPVDIEAIGRIVHDLRSR